MKFNNLILYRFKIPILALVVVFTMFSGNVLALSNYGVNLDPDIDQVLISDFELPLNTWVDDGEMVFERGDIQFYMKDKFAGGLLLQFKELDNRDVFVSVELTDAFIDIYSIGSIASDNGVPLYWNLCNNSIYLNVTLTARADEIFTISAGEAFRYSLDYGYRSKFRALNGESVRLDIVCDANTPNVAVLIEKEFVYYGDVLEVRGNSVMVKYRVDTWFGDAKYPINENRNNPVWYEVRDLDSYYIQVVVHFTSGVSGDVYIVLNPVWYDYITTVGILDACGWDEPVASLGVEE